VQDEHRVACATAGGSSGNGSGSGSGGGNDGQSHGLGAPAIGAQYCTAVVTSKGGGRPRGDGDGMGDDDGDGDGKGNGDVAPARGNVPSPRGTAMAVAEGWLERLGLCVRRLSMACKALGLLALPREALAVLEASNLYSWNRHTRPGVLGLASHDCTSWAGLASE